jgi:hypothetical protein
VELGEQAAKFEAQGLKVAAVTYDSVATLKHFSDRVGLKYPLLSDEGSKTIRAFGIFNENNKPGTLAHGTPFPGTYIVDARGAVKSKYFEEDYAERTTAAAIIAREFRELSGAAVKEMETKHLKLRASATNGAVWAGSRLTLMLDVEMKPKMHVYAPGVEGYIPVSWTVKSDKTHLAREASWPKSRILHLEAIKEKVPVYEGRFRVARDMTVGHVPELRPLMEADGKLVVEGSFRYQACDDKICYQPQTIPLKWEFEIRQLDRTRTPTANPRN